MKRFRFVLVFALSVLLVVMAALPSAFAQSGGSPSIGITGGVPASCTNTGTPLLVPVFMNFADSTPRSYNFTLGVPPNNTIVVNQTADFSGPFVGPNRLSFTPTPYSVPDNSFFTATITVFGGPGGTGGTLATSSVIFNCTTGLPVTSGFVQRTILCDTPVYDVPGGNPVGSDRLLAGQSWHVSPNVWVLPATHPGAAITRYWAEVFVGSPQNVFVPMECVSGLGIPPTPTRTPRPSATPRPGQPQPVQAWAQVFLANQSVFIPANCVGGVTFTTDKSLQTLVPVLATITCDTAVYDAPAGNPVKDVALRAGQTWFVSPLLQFPPSAQPSPGRS